MTTDIKQLAADIERVMEKYQAGLAEGNNLTAIKNPTMYAIGKVSLDVPLLFDIIRRQQEVIKQFKYRIHEMHTEHNMSHSSCADAHQWKDDFEETFRKAQDIFDSFVITL